MTKNISVITLFPQVFEPILTTSILKRATAKGLVKFNLIDLRDFGEGLHQVVDGRPYGGGVGMVFRADILSKAWKAASSSKPYTILMSASGTPFKQKAAQELTSFSDLIIICGHYEGIDQRFIDKYVDCEVSIGDYVLTGGEIPAMAVIDAVTRLIPGVLEKPEAVEKESFSEVTNDGRTEILLEHPQYTRPEEFEGLKVPDVLLSGNHQEVDNWRLEKSREKTKKVRPDLLLKGIGLTKND